MKVLLVRHAVAGKRRKWDGDDRLRPLDQQGRKQAETLADALDAYAVERICSSPYVRCRETVEPLGRRLGIAIEDRNELAEGAGKGSALALAEEIGSITAVLCTHGDVVVDLLGEESEKGSTWVLEIMDGRVSRREYLPPRA
jgi:phosphohistidine phosphatase SixA